jgi:hypothetical protein
MTPTCRASLVASFLLTLLARDSGATA